MTISIVQHFFFLIFTYAVLLFDEENIKERNDNTVVCKWDPCHNIWHTYIYNFFFFPEEENRREEVEMLKCKWLVHLSFCNMHQSTESWKFHIKFLCVCVHMVTGVYGT